MSIEEIRLSGILEDYALGLLSADDVQKVEGYLMDYPKLQADYLEIQRSLEMYARANAVKAPASLENSILHQIKNQNSNAQDISPGSNFNIWSILAPLFGLLFLSTLWLWRKDIRRYKALETRFNQYIDSCDSINNFYQSKLEQYQNLGRSTNRALAMTPTPNYQQTSLIFHTNDQAQENFLQVQNLPVIASDQSFQLWSLKEGQDPIPLDIFKGDSEYLIPLSYEPDTRTYAITIEPEGGSESPTLSQLIGTVNI